MTGQDPWERYQACLCDCPEVGVTLDYSRMDFADDFFAQMQPAMEGAFDAMAALEAGAIANPSEKRQVGHYWLRNPELAPAERDRQAIVDTLAAIRKFARAVHAGRIKPPRARVFRNVLLIGIGGSALGPQFVSRALSGPRDKMRIFFFDNTDPEGMEQVLGLAASHGGLKQTLAIVVSKSGGTRETRNGMLEAEAAWRKAKLDFAPHAVAVTRPESDLDKYAVKRGWLRRFPMWDWVGGRTSELSAVGLLPAALQGFNIDALLKGARDMDALTRRREARANPAALLALMWHHAGQGRGLKDLVVLPYKDRLDFFARYLQQLVMESLGKETDLAGNVVNQGIVVYGNKGSTDQHAYIQQLRDGPNNFFAVFIEVLRDGAARALQVEPGVTSGDYLSGFLQGTRKALHEKGRESLTITIERVDARTLGVLIALFERAVGFYASLINVNAYDQPGVEAGKKAAGEVLALQHRIVARLKEQRGKELTAAEIAAALNADPQTVFCILRHLAANPGRGIRARRATPVTQTRFTR